MPSEPGSSFTARTAANNLSSAPVVRAPPPRTPLPCGSAPAKTHTSPFSRDFEQEPGYVDLYYKAWELAFDHIIHQEGMPQTPYMDEAFADSDIWIWDTCFMVQFCKYSPDTFPGIQSLNNFYKPIHDCANLPVRLHLPDNPPLFA